MTEKTAYEGAQGDILTKETRAWRQCFIFKASDLQKYVPFKSNGTKEEGGWASSKSEAYSSFLRQKNKGFHQYVQSASFRERSKMLAIDVGNTNTTP